MERFKQELIDLGKGLKYGGFVWGQAGNISCRVNEETILISASGTTLGELTDTDFSTVSLQGDFSGKKPSKELPLHLSVYKNRPDVGAVIHATPFYATLVACSKLELKTNLFVESMYYMEHIKRIPFENPGSPTLKKAVEKCAGQTNIILMENHGVLVYDTNIKEALTALEILEATCKMNVVAYNMLCEVPQERVASFLNDSSYKPRRILGNENIFRD